MQPRLHRTNSGTRLTGTKRSTPNPLNHAGLNIFFQCLQHQTGNICYTYFLYRYVNITVIHYYKTLFIITLILKPYYLPLLSLTGGSPVAYIPSSSPHRQTSHFLVYVCVLMSCFLVNISHYIVLYHIHYIMPLSMAYFKYGIWLPRWNQQILCFFFTYLFPVKNVIISLYTCLIILYCVKTLLCLHMHH